MGSTAETGPDQVVFASRNSIYRGVNERHVVPPKAALRMAEMHGTYEPAFGANGDPARFYAICAKENGTRSSE